MAKSFSEAFKAARKEKGPGKTFTWQGKTYTTNYAEEEKVSTSPRPKAKPTQKGMRPKPRPKKLAPEKSPRPKGAKWARVRHQVGAAEKAEEGPRQSSGRGVPKKSSSRSSTPPRASTPQFVPSRRQTVGESLRSIPDQVSRAVDNLFKPNPKREERMEKLWKDNISP